MSGLKVTQDRTHYYPFINQISGKCGYTYNQEYKRYYKEYAEIFTGENWEDWRGRIDRVEDATTTLEAVKTAPGEYVPCELTLDHNCQNPWLLDYAYGTACALPEPATPVYGTDAERDANNAASVAFLRDLIEIQQAFSGGLFLGELRETIRMIKSPAKALRKGIDDYLSAAKKLQKKARVPKTAANMRSVSTNSNSQIARGTKKRIDSANEAIHGTLLEYNFGWQPFINDLNDIALALADNLPRYEVKYVRARGTNITRERQPWNHYASIIGLKGEYEVAQQTSVVYRGAVKCERMTLADDMAYFGFNIEDFIPTLWELLPYSFLIDYFTNIGDFLTALSWQRAGLAWSNKTVRILHRNKVLSCVVDQDHLDSWSTYQPSVTKFVPQKMTLSSKVVNRASYTGDFIPEIVFQIPGVGDNKWINIRSLISARNSGDYVVHK